MIMMMIMTMNMTIILIMMISMAILGAVTRTVLVTIIFLPMVLMKINHSMIVEKRDMFDRIFQSSASGPH